ncbi:hypothetical protein [Nocardia sp. alder85J]|uniref:hypothetical protein n=1 Tax=Nocardia sp. alder85J TaxID=2862949 RepID=UPI001CD463C4|nr:hypothetical protein [Nocardia sp. alder85J]MCX4098148.1 hypothetical protein [Nocardia sp. alder85J]
MVTTTGYWEVQIGRDPRRIAIVRAWALGHGPKDLPAGVTPLHPAFSVLAGEWCSADTDGITVDFPFPLDISWTELEF